MQPTLILGLVFLVFVVCAADMGEPYTNAPVGKTTPTAPAPAPATPTKGTDENNAERQDVIKRIREIRKQLRGQGQTLQPFDTTLSLEQLKKYEKNLSKRIGTTPATAPAPTPAPNQSNCDKLAAKSVWRRFDFRARLAKNNKCPSGWEATGCGPGMGELSNKQCRRRKTKVRSELIKSIDANRAELIKRGVKVVESGDSTKRKMIKNRNLLKARAEAIQKNLDLYNTTGAVPGNYPTTPAPFYYNVANAPNPSSDPGQATAASVTGENDSEMRKLFIKGIKEKQIELKNLGIYPVGGTMSSDFSSWTIDQLRKRNNELTLQISNAPAAANEPAAVRQDPPELFKNLFLDAGLGGQCNDNSYERSVHLVGKINSSWPEAFAIVTYVGKGGDAEGHTYKKHVECAAGLGSRGYDMYVWAPGATGKFVHKNGPGLPNWFMKGGKWQQSWKNGSTVTIAN